MVGHTPEYIKCAVETDAPDNTIIDAIIEGELTADVMKAKKRLAEIDEMYYNIIV